MLDGEIKGELKLGKYEEADGRNREQRTVNWLSRMGW
jgi:putative ABC transport system ATP-binding protein